MSYVDLGDECPSCRMTYLMCGHATSSGTSSPGGRSGGETSKQCECVGDISLYGRCLFCVFDGKDKFELTDDEPYSVALEVFERGRRHGKECKRSLYNFCIRDDAIKSLFKLYRAGFYYGALERAGCAKSLP